MTTPRSRIPKSGPKSTPKVARSRFVQEMARLVNIDGPPPVSTLLPDWVRVWSEPEHELEPPMSPMTIFEIIHRSGVWEVRRDRRFYADYLVERYAYDEVEREIAAIRLAGGEAGLYDPLS